MPQLVVDGTVRAEHQQVGHFRPFAEALAAQLLGLLAEQEGAAVGEVGGEGGRRDDLRVDLATDGGERAVVEEVTDGQTVVLGGVEGKGCAADGESVPVASAPEGWYS